MDWMNRDRSALILAASLGLLFVGSRAQDLVVADFEGSDYGPWKTGGTAFGNGPARGALPGQMAVEGFHGTGLVNSYQGGDGATGRLTSPPFKIERRYLQFLIGGGGWDGKTCMNLLHEGKVVRTAVGPNTQPGGSERLEPAQWDVAEFQHQDVVLEIIDSATTGWGHVNVDYIVQSDQRNAAPILLRQATREFVIRQPFLNFPVKNGATKKKVTLFANGRKLYQFDIELADQAPEWWAFFDAAPFADQKLTVQVDALPDTSGALAAIEQTSSIKDSADLYRERLRPQFHFTSKRGWLNDPNGLVFFKGEYHLFYQHNPYGWGWGDMHWGHAVSTDLVHWKELPIALYPDEHGAMFSGSAVVDWHNTAGFQTGQDPALVAMYTSAGNPFTQCLAYSNDRGRTWTKYANNPVVPHLVAENRDPKVVWFAPGKKWIMSLYLDHNDFALFESGDLKRWEKLDDFKLPGDAECPNFFPLPLNGNAANQHWVFFGANGICSVGQFDGKAFKPETPPRRLQDGNCWYAAQVFSDIPARDGRTILIPWGRLPEGAMFRGMPFNQMMGLPVELKLLSTAAGPSLTVQPVSELKCLRRRAREIKPGPLTPGVNALEHIQGDLLEVEAELEVGSAKQICFELRGVSVRYDAASQKVSCLGTESPLIPKNGIIFLRMFVDRVSVDIFGGNGALYMPMAKVMPEENRAFKLTCEGGTARVFSLQVYDLTSAW